MSDNHMNVPANNTQVEFSIPYILSQIAAIQQETSYLDEAIETLSGMSNGESGDTGSPGNLMGQAKAEAIGRIVCGREDTNRQMLRLYERMYEDLSPNPRTYAAPSDWAPNYSGSHPMDRMMDPGFHANPMNWMPQQPPQAEPTEE